jgi:hypothetical protein
VCCLFMLLVFEIQIYLLHVSSYYQMCLVLVDRSIGVVFDLEDSFIFLPGGSGASMNVLFCQSAIISFAIASLYLSASCLLRAF